MNKYPPDRYYPPGLEWFVLRKIPAIAAWGLLGLVVGWIAVHFWPRSGDAQGAEKAIQAGEYALIGAGIFFLTMLITVVIGCVVVWIMKGPRYGADSYPVKDSERPM